MQKNCLLSSVPGYVGCYSMGDIRSTDPKRFRSTSMSINTCRNHCRKNIYRFAYLSKGDTCFCGSEHPRIPVGDTECRIACSGDSNQVCGDNRTASVYEGM